MTRAAATSLLLAIAILVAVACAPPPPPGRARLDLWLSQHVTVVHEDLDVCLRYRSAFKQIVIDDACYTQYPPEVREFLYYHEAGHAVDHQLWNFLRGTTGPGIEQLAQCVAEVVTGISVVYTPEQVARGYWDCPPEEVDHTRGLMIGAGVW